MITYEIKETESGEIIIRYNEDGTVSSFMKDLENSDYQRYLRWLENPNEVEHSTEIIPADEA